MTPELAELVFFLFGLAVTVLTLLLSHYIPWRKRLHRLTAYTIGVFCIYLGMAIWLIPTGQWRIFLGACAFALSGGFAVIVAWGVDHIRAASIKDAAFEQVLDGRDQS